MTAIMPHDCYYATWLLLCYDCYKAKWLRLCHDCYNKTWLPICYVTATMLLDYQYVIWLSLCYVMLQGYMTASVLHGYHYATGLPICFMTSLIHVLRYITSSTWMSQCYTIATMFPDSQFATILIFIAHTCTITMPLRFNHSLDTKVPSCPKIWLF